jgi:hypothetical protein
MALFWLRDYPGYFDLFWAIEIGGFSFLKLDPTYFGLHRATSDYQNWGFCFWNQLQSVGWKRISRRGEKMAFFWLFRPLAHQNPPKPTGFRKAFGGGFWLPEGWK